MVFSSFLFLFCFLPLTLIAYFLAPRKLKNIVLVLASYIFYAWGAPKVVVVLFVSSVIDYLMSKRFNGKNAKRWLITGITLNVLTLAYFKYANFFVGEVNRFFFANALEWSQVLLPIGISFFTFQKISYLVDVYRGVANVSKSVWQYVLYVALFPQLIAGPIIRYHDIAEQIQERTHSFDNLFSGLTRFCLGLGKKVLIADQMGAIADNVFSLGLAERSVSFAWLGIIAYTLQIYFDFSGYSDMAIGLGRVFGFTFAENFNFPYISSSITEFWRRWHISLSKWMKEYLYIPLGGNRASKTRTYANLWIVFLLSGLWHGASWTFIIWGVYHGFFLVAERLCRLGEPKSSAERLARTALTFLVVMIGWVFFRSETCGDALVYIAQMFGIGAARQPEIFWGEIIHTRGMVIMAIALLFSFLPILKKQRCFVADLMDYQQQPQRYVVLRGGLAVSCLILAVCAIAAAGHTPFLYFKF